MIKNDLKTFNVLKDDEIGNLIQLSAKKTLEGNECVNLNIIENAQKK
ncbi:hypothetical protein MQX03_08115 [Chryseobacterium aahli]|nr:hypothetical protein [Chryseobacterium aahli]MCI3937162.1 hypothetical protein [Chryseobacterium aahli]